MKKFKPFNLEDISKEELYENLQRCISEKITYWNRINRAIEELELWTPEIEALKIERNYLLDILRGKDNE